MSDMKFKEQQKEWGVKVAVGAAALLFGLLFTVKPFLAEARILRSQIDVSRERLKLFEETELLRNRLEKLESFFLSAPERSVVLGKISDTANKEKLDVDTIVPRTESAEAYSKLFVEMNAKGSFFQVVKFLKNVDTFNPAVKINTVKILRPQGLKKDGKLQFNVLVETYLKQKAKKSDGR